MSDGTLIGWMSVWLVCVVLSTVALTRFLKHAHKTNPAAFEHMTRQSKRNARWVMRTQLVNPAKDFWRRHW